MNKPVTWKLLIFAGMLFSLLLSCTDINRGQQIDRITASINSLDSIQSGLNNYQPGKYIPKHQLVQETIQRFKENVTDTLAWQQGLTLDAYLQLNELFAEQDSMYFLLSENTKKEKSALLNLLNDVASNNGDASRYNEFITTEEKNVQEIHKIMVKFTSNEEYLNKNSERLQLLMEQLIQQRQNAFPQP